MFENVFLQIGIILGLATLGGILAQVLRQPLIVAFIAVGILLGPSGLGIVAQSSEVELFARLGISLLLFVVGLKLDLHIIRTVGPVALASGLGQVVFTSVVGYLIARLLDMSHITALYVAVTLTFSSTIIIVKLLSDKREVDALHGRIAVGFLIVQDIVVVLVMIGLTAFGQAVDGFSLGKEALMILLRGGLMLLVVGLLMRYVLTGLLHRLAHSIEILMLFAIAWAVLGASAGDALGFSKEVGAFLAGISIASTPYREQVAARLVSLRDFLLLFFFIELGAALNMSTLGAQMEAAAVFSIFVLIGNPFIVMAIMGYMGYRKRTGFLCGLTVAQISEFSIIFVAMGISLGHVDNGTLGLTTLVGLITIALSTYMILYSHPLYEKLGPWLGVFERKRPRRELAVATERHDLREADVIVFGLGRYGSRLALGLKEAELKVLGVEFDPEVARALRRQGLPVRYGDGIASDFLESLPLKDTRWVVSTLPDVAANRDLLRSLRELHFTGEVAVVAREEFDGAALKKLGAPTILYPMRNAVDYVVEALTAIIRPKEDKP